MLNGNIAAQPSMLISILLSPFAHSVVHGKEEELQSFLKKIKGIQVHKLKRGGQVVAN